MENEKKQKETYIEFDNYLDEIEIGVRDIPRAKVERLKEISKPLNVAFFVKLSPEKILKAEYNTHSLKFNLEISETGEFVPYEEGYCVREYGQNQYFKLDENYAEILEMKSIKKELENLEINFKDCKNYEDVLKKLVVHTQKLEEIKKIKIDSGVFTKKLFGDFERPEREEHIYELHRIIKVKEQDNVRICLVMENNYWGDLYLALSNPNHKEFNYLDEDRFCLNFSTFFDFVTFDEISKYCDLERRSIKPLYANKEEIKSSVRKSEIKEKMGKVKDNQEKIMLEEIKKKLKKGLTINDIEIKPNGFLKYDGLEVGIKNLNLGAYGVTPSEILDEKVDFNDFFNQCCNYLGAFAVSNHLYFLIQKPNQETSNKIKIKCGKITAEVKNEGAYSYINDIRINKGEVGEVLKRAICYNKLKDYNALLLEISKCSIKIHNAISNGILINYALHWSEKIPLKLNLEREKNRNFLVLGKEKVGIKNINGIFNLGVNGNNQRNLAYIKEVLLKYSYINENQIVPLLKDGIKGYKDAIKKSEELLKDAITQLNIKEEKVEIDNYEREGYIVQGKKSKYFVTKDLKIYSYPEKRYICVIDRGRVDSLVQNDKLVSRFYALANDNLVIDRVHTLN